MNPLDKERAAIDKIDRKMAKLFEKRMKTAEKIAEIKKSAGLPLTDGARENALIERESQYVEENVRPFYQCFLKSLIQESKNYQSAKLVTEREGAKVLTVPTSRGEYPVIVGKGLLSAVGNVFDLSRKVLVVTDDGVPTAYVNAVFEACKEPHLVTLPHGEKTKNRDTYQMLEKTMLDLGFTRGDCVVSVGGGVVGDLSGFAAATYKRGIDFYIVPTTLLSQVDSSVGGKVGIDYDGYKNVLGAFYPPRGVLIDTDVLLTLDKRQYSAGMAEVIKVFAACRSDLFEKLERDELSLPEMIFEALKIKAEIVSKDEKETGLRRVLNFGHTVGHAVESATAKTETPLLHGECVALGMLAMSTGEDRRRLKTLLGKYSLPTSKDVQKTAFLDAVAQDKKSTEDGIITVRLSEIGNYTLQKEDINTILASAEEVLELK